MWASDLLGPDRGPRSQVSTHFTEIISSMFFIAFIKICSFLGWKRRGWRWARELWLWIMNPFDIIKLMISKQDKQLILRQHKADWTQRRTHWLSPTLKAASSRSWLVTKFQYYPFQHQLVSAGDVITNFLIHIVGSQICNQCLHIFPHIQF